MDPWTTLARVVVYPIARAFADAWFEARAKYDVATEERVTNADRVRAGKFAAAVRVLGDSPHSDSRREDSAPSGGGIKSGDLGA